MDNFSTSYELAQECYAHGSRMVGTVKKNKPFIPPEFQANRRREVGSNLFGFRQSSALLSYVPKKGKSVIILSTKHQSPIVNANGKAEMNLFYNKYKGGVDTMDQMCHAYTCQRATNRWPLAFFMNMLNVGGIASYVLYNITHDIEAQ